MAGFHYRNQYANQSGDATPIPQNDAFAYFYFSDKANPEVFIKVLDFGSNQPYLAFYGGLTDFEYTVTYRVLRTGHTVSFTKPAYTYGGGADNTTLAH